MRFYDIPFGKCAAMDTTFLPGTIVFDLFTLAIYLIPRVLTIDKKRTRWQSGKTIEVKGRMWWGGRIGNKRGEHRTPNIEHRTPKMGEVSPLWLQIRGLDLAPACHKM